MEKEGICPIKIVLVDDSALITERLKSVLGVLVGVECVACAPNVSSANVVIAETKPRIVILDIHLEGDSPKSNGISFLIQLRKQYPEIILIVFTNFANEHYRKSCIGFGADFFFDKSHDLEKVIDTLKIIQSQSNLSKSDSL